jgi:hypothetical protein
MKRYWRIGLVLLIAVAACSDKKAEQAAALKQEIQDLLAKTASTGEKKMLSYGDVTVSPNGDVFDVTIDKVSVTVADTVPVDLGKIGFKLAPEGDDLRKFSDLSLPPSISVKNEDGKENVKIALALDHGSGSWSKKSGQLLSTDLLFKSVDATQEITKDHAKGTDVGYVVTSKDAGDGRWDQQGALTAKNFVVTTSGGQLDLTDLALKSNINGAKIAEIEALRAEMKQAAEGKKTDQIFGVVGKMLQLFKSMNVAFSIGKTSVAAGGETVFTIGGFGFDFGMDDVDQPKARISSNLRYAALAIPQLKALVGGLGAEVFPTDFNMKVSAADLPLSALVTAWSKSLPDTAPSGEAALMGTGLAAVAAAQQVMAQSPVKLTVSDGAVAASAVTGKFTGEVANASEGPSGTLNLEFSDLDAVIARGAQYQDEPTTGAILGVVQQMRALSDRGTDAAGKPIDRFKVSFDASGNTLVNGKALPMGGQ